MGVSWVVGGGSWVVGRGSWVVGRGSWVVGRGSWVVGRGSWVVGRGSWVYIYILATTPDTKNRYFCDVSQQVLSEVLAPSVLGPNLQLPAHVLISPNSFYETLNKGKLSQHFSFWSGKHLLGFLSSCLVMIYEGRTEVLS